MLVCPNIVPANHTNVKNKPAHSPSAIAQLLGAIAILQICFYKLSYTSCCETLCVLGVPPNILSDCFVGTLGVLDVQSYHFALLFALRCHNSSCKRKLCSLASPILQDAWNKFTSEER
jgi:hypothetical protein